MQLAQKYSRSLQSGKAWFWTSLMTTEHNEYCLKQRKPFSIEGCALQPCDSSREALKAEASAIKEGDHVQAILRVLVHAIRKPMHRIRAPRVGQLHADLNMARSV
jgi:hypothetical protein